MTTFFQGGAAMQLLTENDFIDDGPFTIDDIFALPEGQRAELIDGQIYDMATPNRIHQTISFSIARTIADHIDAKNGGCEVYMAPFAVIIQNDIKNYVEPDICIICDKDKLSDRGCEGAPDWIIEIVSPSSRKIDYIIKNTAYSRAGVREYWIVDPAKACTTVYDYDKDAAPTIIPFDQPVQCGIFPDLSITVSDYLKLTSRAMRLLWMYAKKSLQSGLSPKVCRDFFSCKYHKNRNSLYLNLYSF